MILEHICSTTTPGFFLSFDDWVTVETHKSRQTLYELYSKKTYKHTELFSHRVYFCVYVCFLT